jgi:hypothetical protein
MGDMNVLDFVKNVGRNVVTGGMYSLVKAGVDTVKTGNPSAPPHAGAQYRDGLHRQSTRRGSGR